MALSFGDVIWVDFSGPYVGHEQGPTNPKNPFRPCVVLSNHTVMDSNGTPTICLIAPLTTSDTIKGALAPRFSPNTTPGIKAPSTVLLMHVKSVDIEQRGERDGTGAVKVKGNIGPANITLLKTGLRSLFSL